jgi:hypothetical protein
MGFLEALLGQIYSKDHASARNPGVFADERFSFPTTRDYIVWFNGEGIDPLGHESQAGSNDFLKEPRKHSWSLL